MKKFIQLSMVMLGLTMSSTSFACHESYCFAMDEDDLDPHQVLKVSLDGFNLCRGPDEQLDFLEKDLSSSDTIYTEPSLVITPACSPDDDTEEDIFASISLGSSPEADTVEEESLNSVKTDITTLLDPTYPRETRASDHADFYAEKDITQQFQQVELEAVMFPQEKVLAANFFRRLQNAERFAPSNELRNHPNFLIWRIVPDATKPHEEGYMTVAFKIIDGMRFADLGLYTVQDSITEEYVDHVTRLLGMLSFNLCRKTRELRLKGMKLDAFQMDVTEDNELMRKVAKKLGLSLPGKEVSLGVHYTTSQKRVFHNSSDNNSNPKILKHLYGRYFVLTNDWLNLIKGFTPSSMLDFHQRQ